MSVIVFDPVLLKQFFAHTLIVANTGEIERRSKINEIVCITMI